MAYRRTERVKQRLKARHDALIAAARALATEHGMDAVQIAPVAARAGIAAGTVYRYFPAKTDLVEALVADISETELRAIRTAANAAPGPLSALAAALVTFAARAVRERRLIWALTGEPVDAQVNDVRLAFRKALSDEISLRLAAARDGGHLADAEPALVAPAVTGALLEALVGPLAAGREEMASGRADVQTLALFALRAIGIVDARARGLVVQAPWPAELNAT
ncbi:MAG TPA: TetR/AcrR family transcriptional regulator [Xanthobacteraceae bacterium]|nr:TetR/AcrR family transcriptional regulator [Xanthobacteraceae bacterium]